MLIAVAAVLGLLTAPVFAQGSMKGPPPTAPKDDSADKQRAEQIDRDYNATIKRTNPSTANAPSADPWGTIREPGAGKTKR